MWQLAPEFVSPAIASYRHRRNLLLQVIERLPGLTSLDGMGVDAEERKASALALRHERTVMALMLSNSCLLHKLVGFTCKETLLPSRS